MSQRRPLRRRASNEEEETPRASQSSRAARSAGRSSQTPTQSSQAPARSSQTSARSSQTPTQSSQTPTRVSKTPARSTSQTPRGSRGLQTPSPGVHQGSRSSRTPARDEDFPQATRNAFERMAEDMVDTKVIETVRYFLASTTNKRPVKKAEVTKAVMPDNTRAFPIILSKAIHRLDKDLGYRMVEDGDKYYVVSAVKLTPEMINVARSAWSEADLVKDNLLQFVLVYIFMSGSIREEVLSNCLKKVGMPMEKQLHRTLPPVKKLLSAEFVREGYLVYHAQQDAQDAMFELGARAKAEMDFKKTLERVSEIFGCRPAEWDVALPQQ